MSKYLKYIFPELLEIMSDVDIEKTVLSIKKKLFNLYSIIREVKAFFVVLLYG